MTNRFLFNMVGRETSELRSSNYNEDQDNSGHSDLETMVPLTIDADTSHYSKNIQHINCTPVGKSPNFQSRCLLPIQAEHRFET